MLKKLLFVQVILFLGLCFFVGCDQSKANEIDLKHNEASATDSRN